MHRTVVGLLTVACLTMDVDSQKQQQGPGVIGSRDQFVPRDHETVDEFETAPVLSGHPEAGGRRNRFLAADPNHEGELSRLDLVMAEASQLALLIDW